MEKMCHPLAVAVFDRTTDPIPPFKPHTEQLLDSALNLPRQAFAGKELYKTLPEKAAILFYALVQNHPFPNGNKRIATAALLVFLFINNHWLNVSSQKLADWAIGIAKAGEQKPPLTIEDLLPELRHWIAGHIESLPKDYKSPVMPFRE